MWICTDYLRWQAITWAKNLTQISVAIWRYLALTHSGRVAHICVSKLTNIGSDNGLLPDRHQAIVWTNPGILLIGPLETNFVKS